MNAQNELLKYESVDGVTVGTIVGTTMLDGMCVTEFGHQALAYVRDKPGIHLLLSFTNLTYMTSQGLTELLRISDAVKKLGGELRLCDVNRQIFKVFEITNLDRFFSVHQDEDRTAALRRYTRSLAIAADEKAWASQDAGG